jgi:PIN domain nuclease of toxin-antitoxin system
MKLLLDTHALVWWLVDSPRLSRAAQGAIAEPRNDVRASVVSGYEIAYQQRLGKLPAEIPEGLPRALRDARVRSEPLTLEHAIAAGRLPGPHRDPWDRLIIAQAIAGGFTVVSAGAVFRDYGVPVCW